MLEAAFYGDDFTGSTDALLQFERCGLRGVLLVDLPPIDELRELATRYDVIGVAGIARSLAPDEQEREIRPILTALRDLNPGVVQYKICSTADSSPHLGSLGRALEVGRSIFGPAPVPFLAAQPELGRYTVFGHHFAAEAGTVHRLDRQPTMANHPATPMRESDLRVHLANQTNLRIGSINLTMYADLREHYARCADVDVLVLDALTDDHLHTAGQAILTAKRPAFAIGSGGLSRGLALNLTQPNPHQPLPTRTELGAAQVLAVSGSQSARTAEQIARAAAAGWTVLDLGHGAEAGPEDAAGRAVEALQAGAPGVVAHSGRANGRPAVEALPALASHLAEVVRVVAQGTDVRRLLIAGGDTSGRVLRELGVSALELMCGSDRFGPGVVLCRTIAAVRDLQIVLKPGQMGPADLFEAVRTG